MKQGDGSGTTVDRPLRLAYVVPNLEVGGLQQATYNTIRSFDPRRIEAEVVVLRRPSTTSPVMYERFASQGVAVHDLRLGRRADRSLLGLAAATASLRRSLRAGRYDVVDSATLEADLVSRLAAGRRCVHVTHLINMSYDEVRRNGSARARWRPYAAQLVDLVSARASTRFIALTEAVADSWIRALRLSPRRVSVVPRGVDPVVFPARPLRIGRPVKLLSLGRLTAAKGQDTAVRTVRVLVDRGHDVRLTISGDGPLATELAQLASDLGVADRVDIAAPSPDPASLLADHDVFVFPSRWEGLGNALLEAMSSGRLVVASDLPVLREVAGEQARYAAVGDEVAFADRIEELLALPEEGRQAVATALSERARDQFDLDRIGAALTTLYEQLVAS